MGESTGQRRALVIGAGIVGVCSGLYLQRAGFRVALVDPEPPGESCSFGNAGLLATNGVIPVATPGTLKAVPGWIGDPTAPLSIRWSYLPRLVPWLARFLASSTPARVADISAALAQLTDRVFDAYQPLIDNARAQHLVRRNGVMFVYGTAKSFAKDEPDIAVRRRHGVKVEEIGIDEMRQLAPGLGDVHPRGRFLPDPGHTVSPIDFTRALVEDFRSRGGEIHTDRALGFDDFGPEGPRTVVGERGRHAADVIVVAAGSWSRSLVRALDHDVPLDTERGYHAVLPDCGVELKVPIMYAEGKFALTPMSAGLRVAGTVEFAGVDAEPDMRRARILVDKTRRLFPRLAVDEARMTTWMGRRPSMPDSLPVIGRVPGHRNVLLAFGHGHLGLTFGAITGKLVAELAAGTTPSVDLAPYRPERF